MLLMSKPPPYIEADNLSVAWGRVWQHISRPGGGEVSPLVVSVTGFDNSVVREVQAIRNALDTALAAHGDQTVHTVANTIFPQSIWRLAKGDRKSLYALYLKIFPRLQALERAKNSRGLYFERLIQYNAGQHGNQLEFIIQQHNSRPGVRRSMFQASVFDPDRDHKESAQLAFPCLQHVTFVPIKGYLQVNGFYASQLLFQKAYGNFLGICRLGAFMASQMNLHMGRMTCFVGIEKLDRINKNDPILKPLSAAVDQTLSQIGAAAVEATTHE